MDVEDRHLRGMDPLLGTLADLTIELRVHGKTAKARRLLLHMAYLARCQATQITERLEAQK